MGFPTGFKHKAKFNKVPKFVALHFTDTDTSAVAATKQIIGNAQFFYDTKHKKKIQAIHGGKVKDSLIIKFSDDKDLLERAIAAYMLEDSDEESQPPQKKRKTANTQSKTAKKTVAKKPEKEKKGLASVEAPPHSMEIDNIPALYSLFTSEETIKAIKEYQAQPEPSPSATQPDHSEPATPNQQQPTTPTQQKTKSTLTQPDHSDPATPNQQQPTTPTQQKTQPDHSDPATPKQQQPTTPTQQKTQPDHSDPATPKQQQPTTPTQLKTQPTGTQPDHSDPATPKQQHPTTLTQLKTQPTGTQPDHSDPATPKQQHPTTPTQPKTQPTGTPKRTTGRHSLPSFDSPLTPLLTPSTLGQLLTDDRSDVLPNILTRLTAVETTVNKIWEVIQTWQNVEVLEIPTFEDLQTRPPPTVMNPKSSAPTTKMHCQSLQTRPSRLPDFSPSAVPTRCDVSSPAAPTCRKLSPPAVPTLHDLSPPAVPTLRDLSPPTVPTLRDLSPPAEPTLHDLSPPAVPTLRDLSPPAEPTLRDLSPPAVPTLRDLSPPAVPTLSDLSPPAVPTLRDLSPPAVPTLRDLSSTAVPAQPTAMHAKPSTSRTEAHLEPNNCHPLLSPTPENVEEQSLATDTNNPPDTQNLVLQIPSIHPVLSNPARSILREIHDNGNTKQPVPAPTAEKPPVVVTDQSFAAIPLSTIINSKPKDISLTLQRAEPAPHVYSLASFPPKVLAEARTIACESKVKFAVSLFRQICNVQDTYLKNCNGKVYKGGVQVPNKPKINEDKVNAIHQAVEHYYPCPPSESEKSRRAIVKAIDKANWNFGMHLTKYYDVSKLQLN